MSESKPVPPRIPTAENPSPTGAKLDGWASSENPNEGLFVDCNDTAEPTAVITDTDLV